MNGERNDSDDRYRYVKNGMTWMWVGWDVSLVEYQCEGGRKGIAKCLVHLRMKQIYLIIILHLLLF